MIANNTYNVLGFLLGVLLTVEGDQLNIGVQKNSLHSAFHLIVSSKEDNSCPLFCYPV